MYGLHMYQDDSSLFNLYFDPTEGYDVFKEGNKCYFKREISEDDYKILVRELYGSAGKRHAVDQIIKVLNQLELDGKIGGDE